MKLRFLVWRIALCACPATSFADDFSETASYDVCFTPGQNCTQVVIDAIREEKLEILVQAYSFTSAPIAKELISAKKRGVRVKAILDKSQFEAEKYSASTFLSNQGIPVWIDSKPSIAHNKVLVFSASVITGSFNFTKAAQERNAENLLLIRDASLTERYRKNWLARQKVSTPIADYQPKKKAKRV